MKLTFVLNNKPRWYPLTSTRKKAQISGEIELQFSLTDASNPTATYDDIFSKWQSWLGSLTGTPSSEEDNLNQQVGEAGIDLDDEDDDSSDGAGEPKSEENQAEKAVVKESKSLKATAKEKKQHAYHFYHGSEVVGIVYLEVARITDLPPERNSMWILSGKM